MNWRFRLTGINGELIADIRTAFPRPLATNLFEPDPESTFWPLHFYARLHQQADGLSVAFTSDWLRGRAVDAKLATEPLDENSLLLTASTATLRRLFSRYAVKEGAFDREDDLNRSESDAYAELKLGCGAEVQYAPRAPLHVAVPACNPGWTEWLLQPAGPAWWTIRVDGDVMIECDRGTARTRRAQRSALHRSRSVADL